MHQISFIAIHLVIFPSSVENRAKLPFEMGAASPSTWLLDPDATDTRCHKRQGESLKNPSFTF